MDLHSTTRNKSTPRNEKRLDNLESDSPKEIRRRNRALPTVSRACNNCRQKHLKCDGRVPLCTRCHSKNLVDCAYYSRCKKENRFFEQHSDSPFNPFVQNYNLPLPSTAPVVASVLGPTLTSKRVYDSLNIITNKSAEHDLKIKDYLEFYKTYLYPICEVVPPNDDLKILYETDSTKDIITRLSPVTFIILGYGALYHGQRDFSNHLISVALSEIKEAYDRTTHLNASCHHLLSRYYMLIGDVGRASIHNSITIQMYKNLLVDIQSNKHLTPSYLNALLASAEFTVDKNEQITIYDKVLSVAKQISMAKSLSCYFAIVQKVWTEAISSNVVKDATCYLETLIDAKDFIPDSLSPMLRRELQSLLTACLGGIFCIHGIHDFAKKHAEDALHSVKHMQWPSPLAVQSLVVAIQVLFHESCPDLVNQGIHLLKQIGKSVPIAELIYYDFISPLTASVPIDPLAISMKRRPALHPTVSLCQFSASK